MFIDRCIHQEIHSNKCNQWSHYWLYHW
jgi:hypothetical protein